MAYFLLVIRVVTDYIFIFEVFIKTNKTKETTMTRSKVTGQSFIKLLKQLVCVPSLLAFVLLALFIFSNSIDLFAFAQDDRLDDFTFESEEIEDEKQPYFAISAGATGSLLFMKYDDLNLRIPENIHSEKFTSPIFLTGFNIFSALSPFVNNARIGFSYQTGSKILDDTKDESTTAEYKINFTDKLSLQLAGLQFDYAIVPTKSLAILPGIGIKWGTLTFENFATALPYSWNSPSDIYNRTNQTNNKMQYSFMAVEPKLDVEYALTGFLMFRASAGYVFAFNNPLSKYNWTINGNNEMRDVPSSIKPQGLSLQAGIFLGLLNY